MKVRAWQWNPSLSSSSHGDTGKMFNGIEQEIWKWQKETRWKSLNVSLDLTKPRYNLVKFAQGIVKEMDNASFVCADVNGSLAIRFKNGTIKHFNSEYDFRSLLNDDQFLLLLQFCCCLEMLILFSFWFFIVLRNFTF